MSGATPGPWVWSGCGLDGGPRGYTPVIEAHVECGIYCQGGQAKLDVSAADRALIESAPVLRDACMAALSLLTDDGSHGGTKWTVNKLRAALRSAMGEQGDGDG